MNYEHSECCEKQSNAGELITFYRLFDREFSSDPMKSAQRQKILLLLFFSS